MSKNINFVDIGDGTKFYIDMLDNDFAVYENIDGEWTPVLSFTKGQIPKKDFRERFASTIGEESIDKYLAQCLEMRVNERKAPTFWKPFFKDGRFVPQLLGSHIMQSEQFITIPLSGEMFVWRDGYYQQGAESVIERWCNELLDERVRNNFVSETVGYITRDSYTNIEEPPLHLVNVANGILNLTTLTLQEHSPELMFFQKLPVQYDPNAKCPRIAQFLEEITGSENDHILLEEIAGSTLYRRPLYDKAFMLVGNGSNGKTTFLNLLISVLGVHNVSGKSLQELTQDKFARADLFGKLANIYADLTNSELTQTGHFKMLASSDLIDARRIYQKSFKFVNYAKMIFSCNVIPKTDDDSKAYYRRWVIINFPNTFEGATDDKNLLNKLTTEEELSGFFNVMIAALARVLSNTRFTYNRTIEQTRRTYELMSDPTSIFADECVVIDMHSYVEKQKLYDTCVRFCEHLNIPVPPIRAFYKSFRKIFTHHCREERITAKEGRIRIFKGIKLKDEPFTNHGEILEKYF